MTDDPMYDFIASEHELAPVPGHLQRVLEVVRRDLEPDRGLVTVYAPATDDVAHLWAWEHGGGSASGFRVELTESDPDALWIVALAEWMQSHLFGVKESLATTRPPCGEHPHSMMAKLIDGDAWWVCRYTGEAPVRRIGEPSELASETG